MLTYFSLSLSGFLWFYSLNYMGINKFLEKPTGFNYELFIITSLQ